jgi:hypothetical protein
MNLSHRTNYELLLTEAVAQHVRALNAYRYDRGDAHDTVTVSPLEQVKLLVESAERLLADFNATASYNQYDLVLDLASKVGNDDQFGARYNATSIL